MATTFLPRSLLLHAFLVTLLTQTYSQSSYPGAESERPRLQIQI